MCVNALNRAILISTSWKVLKSVNAKICVNALNRALLISTGVMKEEDFLIIMCVNALNRAILISTIEKDTHTYEDLLCQCP